MAFKGALGDRYKRFLDDTHFKKMSDGGEVGPTLGSQIGYPGSDKSAPKPKGYADGGMVEDDEEGEADPFEAMHEAFMEDQDDNDKAPKESLAQVLKRKKGMMR